jgi:prolipoprotein diacylglyceryltransferase
LTYPFTIQIGSLSLPLHAVLETLAFFIGFRYFMYLRKKETDVLNSSTRIWVIIGAIFGAIIGSRLVGALERPEELWKTNNILFYIYNNKTVVGGFLGGLAGVELVKKRIGETKASGDLFVFPMILALIIGRAGCFSMGVYEETYGMETSFPLAMDLGDGVLRHPVTLYEITFLAMLWISFIHLKKHVPLENGALFKLFMIAYLVFRFALEFIKPHYTLPIGISTIQLACLLGLLYYSPYLLQPRKFAAYA